MLVRSEYRNLSSQVKRSLLLYFFVTQLEKISLAYDKKTYHSLASVYLGQLWHTRYHTQQGNGNSR